jgi:hypothetical protein
MIGANASTGQSFGLESNPAVLCSRYFGDDNFLHHIALLDLVNYIQPFIHFSKDRVVFVEMLCVFAAVTNEELGSTCIPASVRH